MSNNNNPKPIINLKNVEDIVRDYMADIDWVDHIEYASIEDAVTHRLERMDWDDLVEGAVQERTDNRLYEVVSDAINDLDMEDMIPDRRLERAVDAAIPWAIADHMDGKLSAYFRSPEGEMVLADFFKTPAGKKVLGNA